MGYSASLGEQPTYTCSTREDPDAPVVYYDFLPVFVGDLTMDNSFIRYRGGKCFGDVKMSLEKLNDSQYEVVFDLGKPYSLKPGCHDTFMLGNTEVVHLDAYFTRGAHKITFDMPDQDSQDDAAFGGIKVYSFCGSVLDEIESVLKTLTLFVGGLSDNPNIPIFGSHIPPYMEKANLEFLEASMGMTLAERPSYEVEVDESLIKSGDFFLIMRLDGLDPMVMWGTGSGGAHCTMAMWFDDELYVVESQDSWYWPTAGLQKTPFKTWIQQAKNADYNVVWLPLSPESAQKFDVEAATTWFESVEGLPYGFHNFIYGWIDTPTDNWPPLLPKLSVPILFSILHKVIPYQIDTMFTDGLNMRLGTEGLSIEQVAGEAARRGMSIDELMAVPEIDGWQYSGIEPRDGDAYVCSAFTTAMYKAAGMFDDMEIQATEFHPRDVYMLDFFDKNFTLPENCAVTDPTLPYCQLLGKYRIDITREYSIIAPYEHMNESCPTVNPDYFRPDGC